MPALAPLPIPKVVPIDFERVRTLREAAGLSVAEAARRAGMKHRQQWWLIENARKLDPTVSTLQRIAAVLDVEPADLLTPLEGDEWKCE
ncbi:MAG: helix-turn-helix transcriptional regulator [Planctomycetota bacterium]